MRPRMTIAACCLLAACGGDPAATDNQSVMNASVPDAPPVPMTMETLATPTATPTSPTAIAMPSGADAAVGVVDAYYRAIDERDYAHAYRLWRGDGAASGQTLDQFTRGFAHTRSTNVAVGEPADPEGAAGSLYITIPVTVSAIDDAGEQQRFAGNYVLRRANDVPGASATDRSWRIDSASLHHAP